MKFLILLTVCLVISTGAQAWAKSAKFHIGICTPTASQAEDALRGAEALIQKYGKAETGGIIKHIMYPDNFMDEIETTSSQLAALADDPLMKAIIMNQAIPGTAEGFRRIREKRPDILLIASETHEDPNLLNKIADLIVNADSIARGYLIIAAAKKLGVTNFVHISFQRHMESTFLLRRHNIMEVAATDLGIHFNTENAPDPALVGVSIAQQFIFDNVPKWLEKYGSNTAFFCTNDAHTEPLLKRIIEGKGYFIEADAPSPLLGYPGALGLDFSKLTSNFPAMLKILDQAIIAKNAAGRLGTWAFSYGFTNSYALGELVRKFLHDGGDVKTFRQKFTKEELVTAYNMATPGANWNAILYKDLNTNNVHKNHVLVYQDTYILGQGYLKMTDISIPKKYFNIR